jgi:hypothetical protein
MFGSWRRLAVVGLLVFVATAATLARHASSDDCQYGELSPEHDRDGRGCGPPNADTGAAGARGE